MAKPKKAVNADTAARTTEVSVSIPPPKFETKAFRIRGTAPLVQNKFSSRSKEMMEQKMLEGSTAKKGRKREARDFSADCAAAAHVSTDGWYGIPAPAFRNAMISACKIVGFQMTRGKLALFTLADGVDADDGTPLVRITSKSEPIETRMAVRNASGVTDIRARPMWREWEATIRIKYDADMFALADVVNLLLRAGMQVGVCAGRPDSRQSNGMGWGTFELVNG